MGTDNRYLADFSDVAAIRFECACGAAVVQPPEKAVTNLRDTCFVCGAQLKNKEYADNLILEIKALRMLGDQN